MYGRLQQLSGRPQCALQVSVAAFSYIFIKCIKMRKILVRKAVKYAWRVNVSEKSVCVCVRISFYKKQSRIKYILGILFDSLKFWLLISSTTLNRIPTSYFSSYVTQHGWQTASSIKKIHCCHQWIRGQQYVLNARFMTAETYFMCSGRVEQI